MYTAEMYVLYSIYVHSIRRLLVDTGLGDILVKAIVHGLVQESWGL